MMNKSEIDWCDFSWNPVTGCRRGCEYCYARNQARRFSGDVRVNVTDPQIHAEDGPAGKIYTLPQPFKNSRGTTIPHPAGFEPTFHEYRLGDPARKKKPASIFVCSMADLFGPWVPDEWIARVFEACKAAPWHNYMFLTKYPERYAALANAGELPDVHECPNFWYGTTVTKAGDRAFTSAVTYHTFLSIEPISGPMDAGLGSFGGAEWVIVGAETGNRKGKITPERDWIRNIMKAITSFSLCRRTTASHTVRSATRQRSRPRASGGRRSPAGRPGSTPAADTPAAAHRGAQNAERTTQNRRIYL